jgi:predicted DNA-binding transcriptional regulator AlpA
MEELWRTWKRCNRFGQLGFFLFPGRATEAKREVHGVEAHSESIDKILRFEAVIEWSGLSKPTILRMARRREFPQPIKLSRSGRAIGWRRSELIAWLESRPTTNTTGAI